MGDPSIGEERVAQALRVGGGAEFMARLPKGLHTEVGEKGARFSGGQRQRIAIAPRSRAPAEAADPGRGSSVVDNETEKDICENIRQISLSITVLAMSHRQAWIDIADRVLLLSGAEETPSVAGAATES